MRQGIRILQNRAVKPGLPDRSFERRLLQDGSRQEQGPYRSKPEGTIEMSGQGQERTASFMLKRFRSLLKEGKCQYRMEKVAIALGSGWTKLAVGITYGYGTALAVRGLFPESGSIGTLVIAGIWVLGLFAWAHIAERLIYSFKEGARDKQKKADNERFSIIAKATDALDRMGIASPKAQRIIADLVYVRATESILMDFESDALGKALLHGKITDPATKMRIVRAMAHPVLGNGDTDYRKVSRMLEQDIGYLDPDLQEIRKGWILGCINYGHGFWDRIRLSESEKGLLEGDDNALPEGPPPKIRAPALRARVAVAEVADSEEHEDEPEGLQPRRMQMKIGPC